MASLAWVLYAIYELPLKVGVGRAPDRSIRVDLPLVCLLLLLLCLVAVVAGLPAPCGTG